jgi:Glycosyl transferases group 1
MIKILTVEGDASINLLHDVKLDFWLDVQKTTPDSLVFTPLDALYLKYSKYIYHILERLPFSVPLSRISFSRKKNTSFAVILGPNFGQFVKSKLKGDDIVVYMMDAWPSYHQRIERAIKIFGIKTIFFSSKQVADIFKAKGILDNAIWLPEAVRIEKFHALPMNERNIDVLNFGRKWDLHHDKIVKQLESSGISYLYEKIKGILVLPTTKDFLDALSRAKITICVPSNITHAERSGEICTITMRYFQCMAAKTIVLGIAPDELKELFGYNPVIEIDMSNPVEQIQHILKNLSVYDDLVEKNYQTVKNNHTWSHRWLFMNDYLTSK